MRRCSSQASQSKAQFACNVCCIAVHYRHTKTCPRRCKLRCLCWLRWLEAYETLTLGQHPSISSCMYVYTQLVTHAEHTGDQGLDLWSGRRWLQHPCTCSDDAMVSDMFDNEAWNFEQ
jgi:hypothetical protein